MSSMIVHVFPSGTADFGSSGVWEFRLDAGKFPAQLANDWLHSRASSYSADCIDPGVGIICRQFDLN